MFHIFHTNLVVNHTCYSSAPRIVVMIFVKNFELVESSKESARHLVPILGKVRHLVPILGIHPLLEVGPVLSHEVMLHSFQIHFNSKLSISLPL